MARKLLVNKLITESDDGGGADGNDPGKIGFGVEALAVICGGVHCFISGRGF